MKRRVKPLPACKNPIDNYGSAQRCIDELGQLFLGPIPIHPVSSCGYVIGRPKSREDLINLIRQADISTYDAKKNKESRIAGGAFDPELIDPAKVLSDFGARAHETQTDSVTGLPNMSFFIAECDDILRNVIDMSRKPLFVYFNVIGFQQYNAEHGFQGGDQLLVEATRIIREFWPKRLLARLDADHFIMMAYEDDVKGRIEELAEHIRKQFDLKIQVGIYYYEKGIAANACCDRAKLACESIRANHNKIVAVYDRRFDGMQAQHKYIIDHIDDAIAAGDILTYYQPIMNTKTGKICCEEALARWKDPDMGIHPPTAFVPILEQNHLTYKLDLAMVDNVVRDFGVREKAGMPLVPITINLSRFDFDQCDMVQEICERIDRAGYPHRLLIIEITESAFVKDEERIRREVARFHKAGFEVWMDDFGSGYSALSLLHNFDFDVLKIDMQFAQNLTRASKNYVILDATINMAKKLGIGTLCEGVESNEQRDILTELGCERLQGFLYNKPNDLKYIIQRFRSGTGLDFETT